MAKVIVSFGTDANRWAEQFCRTPRWTRELIPVTGARRIELVRSMSRASIVSAIERAARTAGPGGEVIYSVGHGNSQSVGDTVQPGLNQELTVTQRILSADDQGRIHIAADAASHIASSFVGLDASELVVHAAFRQIGTALHNARVSRFTFLVCVLGNNRSFLRQIKTFWGGAFEVAGYTAYVTTDLFTMQGDATYPRIPLYLTRDLAGQQIIPGTNAEPATFLELPSTSYLTVV